MFIKLDTGTKQEGRWVYVADDGTTSVIDTSGFKEELNAINARLDALKNATPTDADLLAWAKENWKNYNIDYANEITQLKARKQFIKDWQDAKNNYNITPAV